MALFLEDFFNDGFQSQGFRFRKPFGYGPGAANAAGGTVTQLTNRTTAVTLNTAAGQITTSSASLAAEAAAAFTVNDSVVSATDIINVSIQSGSNGGDTDLVVTAVATGSFQITVVNNNPAAGTAETGAIVINFAIIKGSIT